MPRFVTSTLVAIFALGAIGLAPTLGQTDAQGPQQGPAAAGDVVIDDLSDGFRRVGGGWRTSLGGYDNHHFWSPARRSRSRIGIWSVTFDEPGLYKVQAKIPSRHASSRRVVYKVKTESGWTKRVRNQYANRGSWMSLGVHRLPASAEVRLSDRTLDPRGSGRKLAFDAVRFVPLDPPEPPVIVSLEVEPKLDRAIVTFSLAEPGPAKTEYRKAGNTTWLLGANETSSKYADHRQVIGGLKSETDYESRVIATNKGGKTISPITRLTTLAPPPPVIKSIEVTPKDTRATVRFSLVAKGPARSEYRKVGAEGWLLGAEETSAKWADHVQTITGLRPETAYELRVIATNAVAKTVSDIVPFTTKPRVVDCAAGDKLQGAIDKARAGDTLIIEGTCHGHFRIDKDLTLRGRGDAKLDGGGSGVLVRITERPHDKRVHLVGLALRNAGTCVSVPSHDRSVSIEDAKVTGCGTGVSKGDGGGVSIHSSLFRDNRVAVSVGQVAGATIVDSVIEDNHTGVKSAGGASILGSTIRRNGPGGGVDVVQYLTVRDSRIIDNHAGSGGGIDVGGMDTSVTIEDTLIRGNRATTLGGGMYRRLAGMTETTLRNVVFEDNVAGVDGGGLYNEDPSIVMTNVTFTNNKPNDCTGC